MNLPLSSARRLRRQVRAAVLLALISTPCFADGSVAGSLRHATHGTPLPGAAVRLLPGEREVATDREGAFHLSNVPAGTYTLEATYLGLEPHRATVRVTDGQTARVDARLGEGAIVMEAFTVESLREGQSRAINQQRTASTISNIISSDAIGNLPDRTVGEALARLPGVNVVDDQWANIRGTPAEHNAVTLDGDRFTTAGGSVDETSVQYDNRAVDLSLIPAEMVGGIEVIKALSPDMDADSFGGTINLVSRSAFDLKERSLNGKFEYIRNSFRRQPGHSGSITYMDVLDKARTLGLAATLTYRKEDRMINDYEFAYYDAGALPVGTSGSGTAGALPAVGDQGMEAYDTRLKFQTLEKIGATVNLDWKASDATELHLRTFYQDSDNQGGRFRNRVRATSRWNATSTAALQSGAQVRFQNYFEDGNRDQQSLRLGVEGKTRLLSGGTLKYGIRYGDSEETAERTRYIFDFPSNTERRAYGWSIDRSNPQLPVVSMTHLATGRNGFLYNLTDRKLSSLRFLNGKETEEDLTGNLDYSFPLALGPQAVDWKVGAKIRGKDRRSRPRIQDFSPPASAVPTMADFPVSTEPQGLLRGSQATMGTYVSLPAIVQYYNANRASFAVLPGSEIRILDARTYDVNEDVAAAYAMGTTKFGRLEVIGGARWEQTKTGYNWISDPLGASRGSQRYDNFRPSLLANYRFDRNVVARFAYTHTLSRPAYGDLIPYRAIDDTQGESGNGGLEPGDYPETNKVYLGNAKLKAQRSENFDLSLEYYLPRSGVVSAAVFRKNLRDVIFRSQWKLPTDPSTIYFQERNGSSGRATGLELAWQQALTFLPKPLDGFGVNLNATFIRGSSVLDELVPGTTASYRALSVGFLPEQPKKVFNAQLWWEKFGFTARVAVNYIDEFVRTSGGLTAFSVNDEATRVDASLSYRLSKHFTLYLEGRNLTSEVTSWYATTKNRPEDYTYTGAIYTGGVKFRF
ncbi:MAG: TonB-dependent receptor [Verrucomicrobia bacterium]|nr:TonB-dependent receptor [Verrucomicrobiota bacterium]